MSKNNIAVIGGGASGLMAAITAKSILKNKADVVIFERFNKLGKKLLTTGNGKCNLSNKYIKPDCYNNSFAMKIIDKFDTSKTIKFFNCLGLETYTDGDGRIYPQTEQAASVQSCLEICSKHMGINLKNDSKIEKLTKLDKNFIVNGQIFDALILATGSGAGGKNYVVNDFLELNLKYTKRRASLVPIKTDTINLKYLDGVRAKCKVTLYCNLHLQCEMFGEVLFRDYGLSGIVIFDISKKINELLRRGENNFTILIDMFPTLNSDELLTLLKNRLNSLRHTTITEYFTGLINSQIIKNMVLFLGFKGSENSGVLDNKLQDVVKRLKQFKFNFVDFCDITMAQVVSGGVDLNTIKNTLEHKDIENLFLCGEILDVDGMCGGYNLQFAWSSGYVAGQSLANKLLQK